MADDMSIISYDEEHGMVPWRSDEEVMSIYQSWMVKHGKIESNGVEGSNRFEVFKDNLRFIDEHNSKKDKSFELGLNRFADLTNDEYRVKYLGVKNDIIRRVMKSRVAAKRYAFSEGDMLPDSIDWRKSGAVGPVKDQGSCGTCLYF